jgi:antitoxin YefM
VLLSLADYQSLEETAYLLRTSANARRLLESMLQAPDERCSTGWPTWR